jgi:hypothetical protein
MPENAATEYFVILVRHASREVRWGHSCGETGVVGPLLTSSRPLRARHSDPPADANSPYSPKCLVVVFSKVRVYDEQWLVALRRNPRCHAFVIRP